MRTLLANQARRIGWLALFGGTIALQPVQAVTMQDVENHKILQTEERLRPVGNVRIEGASTVASEGGQAQSVARSPEQIYNTYCLACHMTGAAGAPKLGDKSAWSPRIAKGVETLVANAIKGINAMPAKGTCMDCSDEDIKATVEYIVGQSK